MGLSLELQGGWGTGVNLRFLKESSLTLVELNGFLFSNEDNTSQNPPPTQSHRPRPTNQINSLCGAKIDLYLILARGGNVS